VHPEGNCSNHSPWTERANGEFCLICGKPSASSGVTVLGRLLCLECMETISQIDVSDEEYSVITEKLKELWEPVLAEALREALRRKNQDKGEGYDHREDRGE